LAAFLLLAHFSFRLSFLQLHSNIRRCLALSCLRLLLLVARSLLLGRYPSGLLICVSFGTGCVVISVFWHSWFTSFPGKKRVCLGGRLSVGFSLPASFRGHISRYRGLEFLPVLIPEAFPFGVAFDSGIECFCDHMTDCRWILFVQVRAVSDELCIDVRAQPNAVGCDWRFIFRC
jgi:hypothetical protein